MNLIRELKPLVGNTWAWDVRPVTQLPPGAWLKRNVPTGTCLDWFAPEYVHPLELLAVRRGRFGDGTNRTAFEAIHKARLSLRAAFTCWSQALGTTIREVAKWYWVFTPVAALDMPNPVLRRLLQTQGEAWAAFGLDPRETVLALASATNPGPAVNRPAYWTVDARND